MTVDGGMEAQRVLQLKVTQPTGDQVPIWTPSPQAVWITCPVLTVVVSVFCENWGRGVERKKANTLLLNVSAVCMCVLPFSLCTYAFMQCACIEHQLYAKHHSGHLKGSKVRRFLFSAVGSSYIHQWLQSAPWLSPLALPLSKAPGLQPWFKGHLEVSSAAQVTTARHPHAPDSNCQPTATVTVLGLCSSWKQRHVHNHLPWLSLKTDQTWAPWAWALESPNPDPTLISSHRHSCLLWALFLLPVPSPGLPNAHTDCLCLTHIPFFKL